MKTKHNKIAFFTLGCKVNFSETSFLSDEVEKHGFHKVGFRESADIYVIHSCILTGQAEKKHGMRQHQHTGEIQMPELLLWAVFLN
jgi:threonylcarbamoyladenosine tRNA methylthiotransferase MtaB